jgi:hypothetical protein
MVRVRGREVQDDDSFSVAMPISLAKGGAGYFTIWNDPGAKNAKRSGTSLSGGRDAIHSRSRHRLARERSASGTAVERDERGPVPTKIHLTRPGVLATIQCGFGVLNAPSRIVVSDFIFHPI